MFTKENFVESTNWATKILSFVLFALACLIVLLVVVFGIVMSHEEVKYFAHRGLTLFALSFILRLVYEYTKGKC